MKSAVFLFLMLLPATALAAGIGVSPSRLEFDIDSKERMLTIFNTAGMAYAFEISAEGLDLSETEIEINARSSRAVRFTAKNFSKEVSSYITVRPKHEGGGFGILPAAVIPFSVRAGKKTGKSYRVIGMVDEKDSKKSRKGLILSLSIIIGGYSLHSFVMGRKRKQPVLDQGYEGF